MGQFFTKLKKPKETAITSVRIINRSLFDLSPEAQEKLDAIKQWREHPKYADIPVGGNFPEEKPACPNCEKGV